MTKRLPLSKTNTDMYSNSDSDYNSDNEDQFHESNSDEWLLGTIIYKDENRIYSHQSARLFCSNIENFTYNRRLNTSHVNYLAEKIKTTNKVLDIISVAYDGTNLRILNGQHRTQAILKCLKDNTQLDYKLHLMTYIVPEINSKETLELFKCLNHTLNLQDNPIIDDIHNIIEALKERFPKAIFHTDRRRQRPYVDTRRLKNRLETEFLEHFNKSLDVDKMIKCILEENAKYSVTSIKTIFGNCNQQSKRRHSKATQTGWFLTMKDMEPSANDSHKDQNGYKYFCDKWIQNVIDKYKQ